MTWYASHIYAEPNPTVVSALSRHPVLSKGLYLVNSLKGHQWESKPHHGLPRKGLLVGRELCAPRTEEAEWHQRRDSSISWEEITGPTGIDIILPEYLPVSEFGRLYHDHGQAAYPPIAFLRFLKHLHETTNTTVSFYHHFSAAEQAVQQEFAWVFGEEELVYVRHGERSIHLYSRAQMSTTPYEVTQLAHTGVLVLILKHHRLNLPTGYFALHTRHFDWEKYRLTAAR
jgi:hypothetical protein